MNSSEDFMTIYSQNELLGDDKASVRILNRNKNKSGIPIEHWEDFAVKLGLTCYDIFEIKQKNVNSPELYLMDVFAMRIEKGGATFRTFALALYQTLTSKGYNQAEASEAACKLLFLRP